MFTPRRVLRPGCLLFAGLLVGAGACSKSSPSEPPARVALTVQFHAGSGSDNSLTVESSTCACTTIPLNVSVNSKAVGTVACGSTETFALPTGTPNPVQVRLESSEIQSTLTTMSFGGAGGGFPSIALSVRCPGAS
jgi:hypothetical protein